MTTNTNTTRTPTTDHREPQVVVRHCNEFGRGTAHAVPSYKLDAMRRFAGQIGSEYRDR